MTRKVDNPDRLAEEIRRQLGSPGVVRYMNSLPSLTVQRGLPERLRDLLADLHQAEKTRQGRQLRH